MVRVAQTWTFFSWKTFLLWIKNTTLKILRLKRKVDCELLGYEFVGCKLRIWLFQVNSEASTSCHSCEFLRTKKKIQMVKPVPFVKKEMASIYLLFKKIFRFRWTSVSSNGCVCKWPYNNAGYSDSHWSGSLEWAKCYQVMFPVSYNHDMPFPMIQDTSVLIGQFFPVFKKCNWIFKFDDFFLINGTKHLALWEMQNRRMAHVCILFI